jgi:hypothetical protein
VRNRLGDRPQIHGRLRAPFTNNRRNRRYGGQYWFRELALKSLPVGAACVVWTGIGTVGTTALGIYLFDESPTLLKTRSAPKVRDKLAVERMLDAFR